MIVDMTDLQDFLEKTPDADPLREMSGAAAERLMEMEVGAVTGAGYEVPSSPSPAAARHPGLFVAAPAPVAAVATVESAGGLSLKCRLSRPLHPKAASACLLPLRAGTIPSTSDCSVGKPVTDGDPVVAPAILARRLHHSQTISVRAHAGTGVPKKARRRWRHVRGAGAAEQFLLMSPSVRPESDRSCFCHGSGGHMLGLCRLANMPRVYVPLCPQCRAAWASAPVTCGRP